MKKRPPAPGRHDLQRPDPPAPGPSGQEVVEPRERQPARERLLVQPGDRLRPLGEPAGHLDDHPPGRQGRPEEHGRPPRTTCSASRAPSNPIPRFALGASAVKPIEMLEAYSVFMLGGDRVAPQPIVRVVGPGGEEVRRYEPVVHKAALNAKVARDMDEVMKGPVQFGTATYAQGGAQRPGEDGHGRTTTRDAWFCGYSDGIVGVAWTGNTSKTGRAPGNGPERVRRAPSRSRSGRRSWKPPIASISPRGFAKAPAPPSPPPPAPDEDPDAKTRADRRRRERPARPRRPDPQAGRPGDHRPRPGPGSPRDPAVGRPRRRPRESRSRQGRPPPRPTRRPRPRSIHPPPTRPSGPSLPRRWRPRRS